jgi:hypothetical protein
MNNIYFKTIVTCQISEKRIRCYFVMGNNGELDYFEKSEKRNHL